MKMHESIFGKMTGWLLTFGRWEPGELTILIFRNVPYNAELDHV